ncbi:MAG: hypothetical protein JNM27_05725 [Leptospirales bacterium]|nr:hypothetical protein [Leptospirales bacterium]
MHENFTVKKILARGLLSGLFFTALWSTWAYYANLSHGAAAAQKAAITQGSFTIINAAVFTIVMEYMFSVGKTVLMRLLLAFLLPNGIVAVILTSLHYYRGTPNVLATVSPSLIIVAALSLIYVLVIGPRKMAQPRSGLATTD